MQSATRSFSLAMAALLTAPWLPAAQDQALKGGMVQQLQAVYVPTVMDATGIKVMQRGTTLVVKKDGMRANPPKLGYYGNSFEDGQIGASAMSSAADKAKEKAKELGRISWPKRLKVDSRTLAVDEKVYLRKIEIKPASIDLYVQSCGTCDPAAADPVHQPYLAKVSVHFVSGFLTTSNLSQVQQAIDEILAAPDDANAGDGQAAQAQPETAPADPAPVPAADPPPAPAETPLAQIPPPEAPPAEPVRLGDTIEQVVFKLGKPERMVNLDTKEIYIYTNMKVKVTFVKGKVTVVE
jgi:hypothetical protein